MDCLVVVRVEGVRSSCGFVVCVCEWWEIMSLFFDKVLLKSFGINKEGIFLLVLYRFNMYVCIIVEMGILLVVLLYL